MSLPLPDYNKKIHKGDISFVYKGIYHPIQWFGDDPYRPRVETIIIKNGNQIFLRKYDKKGDYDYTYRLPGGSLDNDSSKIKQAENEVNEEALLQIKDIYQTPVSYFENYPDGFLLKNGDICIAYKGTYTEIFASQYKGLQDKSEIAEHDLDDDMANNGKFYYITNVCELLRPEHIDVILSCPFVTDVTKSAIRIMISRKPNIMSIVKESSIVTEGRVINPRTHHYNSYMMIEITEDEQPFGVAKLSSNITDNIWLATDVHIGEPEDTWENKRRRILTVINRKVKQNDHLLFLGDMVGHGTNVTVDMLKGFIKALYCQNIYLILGNNDYFTMEEYKSIGFKAVVDKFNYKNYIFTHCALPDVPEGYLNIHGHIHGSKMYYDMDPDRHIDVWDDNYIPIRLKDIVEKYESGEYVGHRKDFNLMTSTTESINNSIVPIFTVTTRYNSAFGVTTRTITHSTFNHSAISLHSDLSEMYSYVRNLSGISEKNRKTGFDVETLDYYTYRDDDTVMSVNAVFIGKDDFINLRNRIQKYLSSSNKTSYDYKNLFRIVFGVSIDDNNINENNMICSEFVAKMLTISNVDLPKSANLMMPDDIDNLSKTNTNVINVFTGRIKDYDKKKVDKTIKEISSTLSENVVTESNTNIIYSIPANQKYFFLSKVSMNDDVLIPRIPDNFMTKNGYEDNTTPRVCFSKSIDGALAALSRNLEGEELFVHIPDEKHQIYNPTIKEVPDKDITDEVWIKEKVNVKMIGKIKILKAKPKGKDYIYGDNEKATIYFWDWKWLWKVDENGKTVEESIVQEISAFDSESKVMANLSLSTLHKKPIDEHTLKPYMKDFGALQYIDTSDNTKGFIWFDDEENPVAYVNVLNDSEGIYVIQQLQVLPKYRKCGLISQLIDVAIHELKANKVTVSIKNEELHEEYLRAGFKDINETQFSYTMGRGNITIEGVATESLRDTITKMTLFHGSNKLFDTLEPIGLDFGNKFVEPGWSVFLFKKKEYATNWAIFQVLKNNIYRQYIQDDTDNRLFTPGFDAKKYKCLLEEYTFDRCIDILNKLDKPLYGYVYEVDVDRKDVHIGNSSFLDEYTVRKSLKPKNIVKIEITKDVILKSCIILPADEVKQIKIDSMKSRNQMFNRGLIKSLLNTTEYAANGWLAKILYQDIKNGDLVPGDDVSQYIELKGYKLGHMSGLSRIYHYINNTDVKDINIQNRDNN